jgi:Protein of unknown function (DUF2891)
MPHHDLTPEIADTFARIALGHVAREYPNKLDHVMGGDGDALSPRALHPIFFGSYDWHSCVHGYWLLARLYRQFPSEAFAAEMVAQFDTAFTVENVAGELAYLRRPRAAGFERPYGWAWLLMLAAELKRHETPEGRRWAQILQPLADAFAYRFKTFLPKADYPIRGGAHHNTAFALLLASIYAGIAEDTELDTLVRAKASAWYGRDQGAQAWEPSGDDFLSPTLIEAQLMRRLLTFDAFRQWFSHFLPHLAEGRPETLFEPAEVSDRGDGKIAHLDGLNLSRAWAWKSLAPALDGPSAERALAAARRHMAASLPHVTGDYLGEHWLATYALLALDATV